MAIGLFEIDKSGTDLLNKNYSIALVVDNEFVYGYTPSEDFKDVLKKEWKRGILGIGGDNKLNFKIRFHCAIIILLMKKALIKTSKLTTVKIEVCDDIPGHFHEISEMLYSNLKHGMDFLKRENIAKAKFKKDSLINRAAKAFYKNDLEKLKEFEAVQLNIDIKDLRKIIKKRSGNQGQRP